MDNQTWKQEKIKSLHYKESLLNQHLSDLDREIRINSMRLEVLVNKKRKVKKVISDTVRFKNILINELDFNKHLKY